VVAPGLTFSQDIGDSSPTFIRPPHSRYVGDHLPLPDHLLIILIGCSPEIFHFFVLIVICTTPILLDKLFIGSSCYCPSVWIRAGKMYIILRIGKIGITTVEQRTGYE